MDTPVETWTIRVDAETEGLEGELQKAAASGKQFGRAMTSAFADIAIRGKSLSDTIRSLALALSELALKAALKPLEEGIGSVIQGAISGGFGIGGGSGGVPVPFASGGVISSPIAFPLQGGMTGIAGERGAEAIMPLARGPDGRLGVRSNGGGGSMNVTFNVTTPDADSFRRTEGQLSAMLVRAVAQGQRNM
jgi:phage-related minor tail protein